MTLIWSAHCCRSVLFAGFISGLAAGVLTPAVAATNDQWWVSLGAFSSASAAEQHRQQLDEGLSPGPTVLITERDGRTLYRVALGPFDSRAAALPTLQSARGVIKDAFVVADANAAMAGATVSTVNTEPTALPSTTNAIEDLPPLPDLRDLPPITDPIEPSDVAKIRPAPPPVPPPAGYQLNQLKREGSTTSPSGSTVVPASRPAPIPINGVPGRDPTHTRIEVPEFEDDDIGIDIDGKLDEAIWAQVPAQDDLTLIEPDLLTDVPHGTQARYLYTDRGMYIGVKLEQPPESLIARLSSRDATINRDSWGITLDTSGQGLYGYWFTVNLGGSVMDGTVAPEREYSFEWDGPWDSATAELSDGWSAELFLPWSMMAMPNTSGPRNIGFWSNRKVAYRNERWSTPALPFSAAQFMSNLGQMELANVQAGQQLDLFPFVSFTHDEARNKDKAQIGTDVFWRPSSNLQLTATLNPDFGAVESDDVVVNLTAFETFFPEKRLFFLEGQEVFVTSQRSTVRRSGGPSVSGARQTFSNFTPEPTTLLNTRRIGGAPRIVLPTGVTARGEELSRPTDLLGAAKITGQAAGLRYGILTAFEEDVTRRATQNGMDILLEQDGRDFGVARLLYETGGQNRNGIGYIGTLVRDPNDDAVVHGIDAHILRGNGSFKMDAQIATTDVRDNQGYGGFLDIRYVPQRGTTHTVALDYFDDEFDVSDLGFIRRNDVIGARYNFEQTVSQGLENFRTKRWSLLLSQEFNTDGRVVRSGIFLRNRWTFLDESEIRTELDYFPKRWDDRNSLGNGEYKVEGRWFGEIAFGTDTAKPFSYSVVARLSQEELGGLTYQGLMGITLKPNDRFSLDFDLDYARRDGWLLYRTGRNFTTYEADDFRPTLALDYFINAKQQLRLTMQWAGILADQQKFYVVPLGDGALDQVEILPTDASRDFSISRLTAQLRYRWEIAPLSDLFLVYTRGSNLPSMPDDEFSDLFSDAINDPIIDVFVAKLRYRFGR